MNITFAEVEEVVKTLPIGLYAKRRIPMELKKDIVTSYYSPIDDKIVISFDIIKQSLENADENANKEMAIRSMVYHEVSHAILTPTCLGHRLNGMYKDVMNIFEDERIETILKDYYLDVDFKKNLANIDGENIKTPPKNHIDGFYRLVRFGIGDEDLQEKIDKIIRKFHHIHSGSEWYPEVSNYRWEVEDLFDEYVRRYPNLQQTPPPQPSDEELEQMLDEMKNGSGASNNSQTTDGEVGNKGEVKSSDDGQQNNENGNDNDNGQNGESDGQSAESDENGGNEENQSHCKNRCSGKGKGLPQTNIDEIFSKGSDKYKESIEMQKTFELIIQQFNKKNNNGGALVGHSGVFNPRNVGRKDYKFFDRPTTVNGANKYGSLHLNLFLDDSGSYEYNEYTTNCIIKALTDIEKRNKNFTLDVFFCADRHRKAETVEQRELKADGGTSLPWSFKQVVDKAQLPNTYNYNIVLYDGSIYCGRSERNTLKMFDTNNTTIISDSSNEYYLNQLTSAKVILENSDYNGKLFDNIVKVLSTAFR